ncbi:STAS domain-containing protein [Chthonobacter albigriseus]|uniref:STAS domain-containing protein n=1 Tax=Chthonobacter albigriseus TaxID=1683161 RepID=UPI0015EFA4BD|nr:STAS domain-containing protein [Chthonobacter albigriseus]
MEITESRHRDILVIAPVGRLDSTNAPIFDQRLSTTLERGDTAIVIDLSALDYISSIGLSVLLSVAKKVRRLEGRVALAGMNDRIRSVVEISGFTRIFEIHPTVETAVAAT